MVFCLSSLFLPYCLLSSISVPLFLSISLFHSFSRSMPLPNVCTPSVSTPSSPLYYFPLSLTLFVLNVSSPLSPGPYVSFSLYLLLCLCTSVSSPMSISCDSLSVSSSVSPLCLPPFIFGLLFSPLVCPSVSFLLCLSLQLQIFLCTLSLSLFLSL
jgi:hypothetical protein